MDFPIYQAFNREITGILWVFLAYGYDFRYAATILLPSEKLLLKNSKFPTYSNREKYVSIFLYNMNYKRK